MGFPKSLRLQLAVVWGTAVLLAFVLLWLDSREPYKFFWLIPYPSWRAWAPVIPELFRTRPLIATAVIAVPVVTMLVTLALSVRRVRARRRAGRA